MRRDPMLKATLILLICTLVSSCSKKDSYMSEAVITGYDARACACCGGLMINFDGITEPYMGDFKLIDNVGDLGIQASDTFPINVKVDWTGSPNTCGGNHITITRFKRT
jgi:hypothetical protein